MTTAVLPMPGGCTVHINGVGLLAPCRVLDRNQTTLYSGTYAECIRWLAERAIGTDRVALKIISGSLKK